jgi:hypothetical protein
MSTHFLADFLHGAGAVLLAANRDQFTLKPPPDSSDLAAARMASTNATAPHTLATTGASLQVGLDQLGGFGL